MKKFLYIIIMAFLASQGASAQQGFGTSKPDPSAVIDMIATGKGVLAPRVALTSMTDTVTVPKPANALTVFNTATAGTAPNNVLPGYYYWNSSTSTWIRLLSANDPPFAWALKGNAGIDSATNFIGTTDAKPLRFKVNNMNAGMISPVNSNVSFGYKALGSYTGANDLPAELNNARLSSTSSDQERNKAVAIGHMALGAATTVSRATAIGAFAMGTATSAPITSAAIGYRSMYQANNMAAGNLAVGYNSLSTNVSGTYNVAVGAASLSEIGTEGPGLSVNNNVSVGLNHLKPGMTKFDKNVILGNNSFALNNIGLSSVENAVVIGFAAMDYYPNSTLTNRLLIGSRLTEAANVPTNFLLDGDFAAKVLTINNTLKVTDLNSTATATIGNRPVVADANGQLKIGAPAVVETNGSDYTVTASDETILAYNGALDPNTSYRVILPANPVLGRKLNIKVNTGYGGKIIVDGNGKNIEGNSTLSSNVNGQSWMMQYTGYQWNIFGTYKP